MRKSFVATYSTDANGTFGILGESDPIKVVRNLVTKVGPSDANILILGESGVGKELVARAIHENSYRRHKPFVAVNCAALADNLVESELFGHEKGAFTGAIRAKPGYFERAQDGTLFLDEIGELPYHFQAKLLRVIQERILERIGATSALRLNVRIVSATNRDLERGIAEGWFRRDLYYRINVISIDISPLRKRMSEIPVLVNHFLSRHTPGHLKKPPVVSAGCIRALQNYHYPGNVRELDNIIHRAVVLSNAIRIDVEDLPPEVRQSCAATDPAAPEGAVDRKALSESLHNVMVCSKNGKKVIWHRQLRCIMMNAILTFLITRSQNWFSRKSFARYLEAHCKNGRSKYKTAGVYLNILRNHHICEHNNEKANRSAYRLHVRFISQHPAN